MTHLVLNDIVKTYGTTRVVDGLDLSVEEGEAIVLLGPSGCGKTTCLRMIAGFERPDSGSVSLDGRTLAGPGTFVPAQKRQMSVVFQNYALWPHMSVFDNVAYGPRSRKVAKDKIAAQVHEALAMVQLPQMADRYIHQLSGGQQQRVALARGLVNDPTLLLLDEPLSNLDTRLREEMRAEVKRIQQALGVTMVYVTHDQAEALSLADRVVVMNAGRIEQVGPPEEVYRSPATSYVAKALGGTNILDAHVVDVEGGMAALSLVDGLVVQSPVPAGMSIARGDTVLISVRPTDLTVAEATAGAPVNAVVDNALFFGDHTSYVVRPRSADGAIKATGPALSRLAVGSNVTVTATPGATSILRDVHRSAGAPQADRQLQHS